MTNSVPVFMINGPADGVLENMSTTKLSFAFIEPGWPEDYYNWIYTRYELRDKHGKVFIGIRSLSHANKALKKCKFKTHWNQTCCHHPRHMD